MSGQSLGNRDNQIGGPSGESPVRYRHVDRKLVDFILCAVGLLRKVVRRLMPEWFGDTVDKQGDSHASRENHHEITAGAEFGFFVRRWSQLDVSVAVGDVEQKEEEDASCRNE